MGDTWIPDEVGIMRGGEPGGDDQVGEPFSVRFRHAHRPGAMIIRTAYTMKVAGDRETPFLVRVETECLVCGNPEDPGATEQWSEGDTHDVQSYQTVAEAEHAAQRLAEEFLSDAGSLTWDGLAPWERDDS
jgi:hypothetical protein